MSRCSTHSGWTSVCLTISIEKTSRLSTQQVWYILFLAIYFSFSTRFRWYQPTFRRDSTFYTHSWKTEGWAQIWWWLKLVGVSKNRNKNHITFLWSVRTKCILCRKGYFVPAVTFPISTFSQFRREGRAVVCRKYKPPPSYFMPQLTKICLYSVLIRKNIYFNSNSVGSSKK